MLPGSAPSCFSMPANAGRQLPRALAEKLLYGGSVSMPVSARSLNPPMLNTAVYPMS